MSRLIKGQVVTLFALLTALVVTLAACGGGSSSTGGGAGASGSTVAGTVGDGSAAVYPAGQDRPVLVALADMMIEPAHAEGVPNVTVQLLDSGGAVVATQKTDANGKFVFMGLADGQYVLSLQSSDGTFLGQAPVQVDPNTRTEIEMSLSGQITSIEVKAQGDSISGEVEDNASSDDLSSDDDDSSDDGVSDDDSSDDVSGGNSSDDDSSG